MFEIKSVYASSKLTRNDELKDLHILNLIGIGIEQMKTGKFFDSTISSYTIKYRDLNNHTQILKISNGEYPSGEFYDTDNLFGAISMKLGMFLANKPSNGSLADISCMLWELEGSCDICEVKIEEENKFTRRLIAKTLFFEPRAILALNDFITSGYSQICRALNLIVDGYSDSYFAPCFLDKIKSIHPIIFDQDISKLKELTSNIDEFVRGTGKFIKNKHFDLRDLRDWHKINKIVDNKLILFADNQFAESLERRILLNVEYRLCTSDAVLDGFFSEK